MIPMKKVNREKTFARTCLTAQPLVVLELKLTIQTKANKVIKKLSKLKLISSLLNGKIIVIFLRLGQHSYRHDNR